MADARVSVKAEVPQSSSSETDWTRFPVPDTGKTTLSWITKVAEIVP